MDLSTMLRRNIHARKVAKELRSLDDRTLRELGIFRADIPAIAAEEARRTVG
jgi:uncharacterized protein YjiS (DUF1127 family)